MTPPKTLENLTYRENINIFQWALYITNQTSSQNKIYHVQVDWKVNKTFYSSGDDLRENIAVRAGSAIIRKFWIIIFFKYISKGWYSSPICGLLFHVLFKAPWKKKSQCSVTTYPDVTIAPPNPQTVSQEFSMLLWLPYSLQFLQRRIHCWLIHQKHSK